jgi:hypothetical protein
MPMSDFLVTNDVNDVLAPLINMLINVAGRPGYANYQIVTSIAANVLTVAVKTKAGVDPSITDPLWFDCGSGNQLALEQALSVAIPNSDIFAFDVGKIQANDCQLFVYLIDNNGTMQIGVSPNPTFGTVASPYYDAGGQTGGVTQSNIVMSGTRNSTNSCTVIGRINANQLDNNNWQTPVASLVINYPIYETDWLQWLPTYTGFLTPPVTTLYYKIRRSDVSINTLSMGATSQVSNATNFYCTLPFTAYATLGASRCAAEVYDNGAIQTAAGLAKTGNAQSVLTFYKTMAETDNFTNSGVKAAYVLISYRAFA